MLDSAPRTRWRVRSPPGRPTSSRPSSGTRATPARPGDRYAIGQLSQLHYIKECDVGLSMSGLPEVDLGHLERTSSTISVAKHHLEASDSQYDAPEHRGWSQLELHFSLTSSKFPKCAHTRSRCGQKVSPSILTHFFLKKKNFLAFPLPPPPPLRPTRSPCVRVRDHGDSQGFVPVSIRCELSKYSANLCLDELLSVQVPDFTTYCSPYFSS